MNHNKFPTKQLRISDLKSATSKDLTKDQRFQSANNSTTMRNLAAVVHQNSIDTSFNSADIMSPSLFPNDDKLTRRKSVGLFSDQSDNTKDINIKSRIPDILMINKYYGLIPQKFTIASRGTSCSKPSSARRTMKSSSSSAKPRASSGVSQDRRSSAGTKGCRSENDSPDPIKMVVIAPKGVNELKHEVEDKPIDPLIGPVTKKMSVEKYKKWKHVGGGKGRTLSIRTCGNIGNTMSLTNKRLSDGIGSHAIGASGECIANRRVIKIDLNNASWDEENYQITPYSQRATRQEKVEESRNANVAGESEVLLLLDNSRTTQPLNGNIEASSTRFVSHCKKESRGTPLNANHEDNSPPLLVSHGESLHINERTEGDTKNDRIPNECHSTPTDSETTSIKSCTIQEPYHEGEIIRNKDIPMVGEINGNSSNMNDRKLALFQKGGRLSNRTISFDGVVSEGVDKDGFCKGGTGTENLKKRPATATARSSANKTFTTPNNFNPPSKVIPWTQQKAEGGKPLTLAERRAKFQRTTSIHSSSSQSLEVGEDDVAEVDNHNAISQLSLSSPVYREPRKPLYVMQPPEVPTMISQINPNADEDIQIEIEKVAIMLKKMQTFNHFSMSLDSGIEAEMRRKSSDPNVFKSAQSSSTLKSTESLLQSQSLNSTESESSISSVESNSSEEQSLIGGKTSSTSTAASRTSSKVNPNERFSSKSQTEGMTAKQTISKNSSKPPCNTIPKKVSPANSVSSSANATVRRPPLKKAVSISCEQELLKAGGGHSQQNEVNSSGVEKGRSSRPKTAAGLQHQRVNAAGTRPSHNYSQQRVSNNISSSESHNQSGAGNSGTSTSQGSRNRKILIKKALMEINQSSVNLRRKWGTLGRPRTAPTLNKANGAGTMSQQLPTNSQFQQRRKPLKASPLPISGNGKAAFASSGKSLSTGGKSFGKPGEDGNMEQSGPTPAGLTRASSEVPDETQQQQRNEDGDEDRNKGKSKFRQCFSLDESTLLGFSIRSVNDGKIPLFEKWVEMESAEGCSVSTTIMDDEISFLSSKKREQCLKVYEKLLKTGCTVKLDTIFRGMLTPSEYRAFMKAAEKAAQEAEDAAETAKLQEEQFDSVSS